MTAAAYSSLMDDAVAAVDDGELFNCGLERLPRDVKTLRDMHFTRAEQASCLCGSRPLTNHSIGASLSLVCVLVFISVQHFTRSLKGAHPRVLFGCTADGLFRIDLRVSDVVPIGHTFNSCLRRRCVTSSSQWELSNISITAASRRCRYRNIKPL